MDYPFPGVWNSYPPFSGLSHTHILLTQITENRKKQKRIMTFPT